jgi:hypothetical protein
LTKRLIIFVSPLTVSIFLSQAAWCQVEIKTMPADKRQVKTPEICVIGEKVDAYPFYVYQDGNLPGNRFSASGSMGDFQDVSVDLYNKDTPYSGSSCVKVTYKANATRRNRWAGLYWQYPENNWGEKPVGYDLRKATQLTFWARGAKGGEIINTFQVGGIAGKYGDTGAKSIGPITLTNDWKKYTIDLHYLDSSIIFTKESWECWPFMQPLSRIVGGFCWATSLDANEAKDITFYLDEIRYEND